jgi:hypothetical protein
MVKPILPLILQQLLRIKYSKRLSVNFAEIEKLFSRLTTAHR